MTRLLNLFCFYNKFLVYNLVRKNLKLRYRQSSLGVFWSLVLPLLNALLFYFVFHVIIKVQMPHYLVYILSGTLPWAFFTQAIMEGLESLKGNADLVTKVPLPLHVFPLVGTISGLTTLLVALPVILGAALWSGVHLNGSLIFLPVLLGQLFLISYGISMLCSVAYIYIGDFRHLLGIIMQIWFYATPVLYEPRMIPEKFKWILLANPVAPLFVALRQILVNAVVPDMTYLALGILWAGILVGAGTLVYDKFGSQIPEII